MKAILSLNLFLDSDKKKSELSVIAEIGGEKKYKHLDNQFYGTIHDLCRILDQAFKKIENQKQFK